MKIEKAIRTDAKEITELSIRSKDYWNYGEKQIEAWREELTLTEEYIDNNQVFKLEIEKELVGFYAYKAENKDTIKLNFLFVEPKCIGQGYGKVLLFHFLQSIEKLGFKRVVLDSDPNAEKFYSKNGFKVIGKLKSSIKDRYLPIMELRITDKSNTF